MSQSAGSNFIKEALGSYGEPIEKAKPDDLSLSTYRVEKPWGYELWLDLNESYVLKQIHMNKGFRSSLQSHRYKVEANYIIEGQADVVLENEEGELITRSLKVGEGWCVPAGRKHRVIATESYTALEVSTPHLDDITRYQDEHGRGDGKILNEHRQL